ncbi:hypothetical protein TNCV_1350321 [Trichonephila clavipes]|nr:hypothetical protein TNCV_1350321 [Trichonephila clavipes]
MDLLISNLDQVAWTTPELASPILTTTQANSSKFSFHASNEHRPPLQAAGPACSHPRVPRAHQAGSSRRSLAGVRLSESVRCHGPGLALLTNGGVQQQEQQKCQP